MKPKSTPPQPARPRLDLPFTEQKVGLWEWVYDHRVGLCMTVIAYLIAGIVFMSAKIIINTQRMSEKILISIEPEAISEREKIEEQIRQMQLSQQQPDFGSVRNLTSNENASSDGKLDTRLRDNRGVYADELYGEAEAVQARMKASSDAYARGLREEQDMINQRRAQNDRDNQNATSGDSKVKGNVTVSFSLEGRSAVYIHVPAYLCEGGGEVEVSISVNRNGNVVAASLVRGSSADPCLTEMSLMAARKSRFNVSSSAPERQSGTISYIFIPQ